MTTSAISALSAAPARRRSAILAAVVAVLTGLVAVLLSRPEAASAKTTTHARTHYEASVGNAVLKALNAERKAHHLKALSMDGHLMLSARRHDLTMSHYNKMSHQLPHESFFATRISAAGYKWHAAGENIGWNSRISTAGVLQLETMMYNEKAPNDGHRRNILSSAYKNVGIDVYVDRPHHKVWLTTDFGSH
jgi:uncharacterized protein YkwD